MPQPRARVPDFGNDSFGIPDVGGGEAQEVVARVLKSVLPAEVGIQAVLVIGAVVLDRQSSIRVIEVDAPKECALAIKELDLRQRPRKPAPA